MAPSATTNGQTNGVNGHAEEHTPHNPRRQPFASVGDYLSNVSNFKVPLLRQVEGLRGPQAEERIDY